MTDSVKKCTRSASIKRSYEWLPLATHPISAKIVYRATSLPSPTPGKDPAMRIVLSSAALLGAALFASPLLAAEPIAGFTQGTADLKSAGPLAFGPNGVLFIGDPQASAVFAIDTGDT